MLMLQLLFFWCLIRCTASASTIVKISKLYEFWLYVDPFGVLVEQPKSELRIVVYFQESSLILDICQLVKLVFLQGAEGRSEDRASALDIQSHSPICIRCLRVLKVVRYRR